MEKPVILIAEGNDDHRSMLRKTIEPISPNIHEACDGKSCVEEAISKKPDLIIADMRMPKVDGAVLCRQLKAYASTQDIPVVLVGSFEQDTDISRGFRAGAKAYIEKNEAPERLTDVVNNLLSKFFDQYKKTILVVDDSKSIRKMLSDGLANEGYRVITAENGRVALDILQTHRPDLILCDIYMPEMNGFALCNTLHTDPDLSTIPFIVMSTENDAGNMKRMMQYGASSYILKPFSIEQLVIVLEKILSFQFLILLKEKERLDAERQLLISSIASLVNALEARDAYTRGHSERVSEILGGLVKLSGGSRDEVNRALVGGRLHDIGKIGIRDNVLLKPGRLTEEDFNHIKQHPLIGAGILSSIPSISDIMPIVASHHERIDGRGYPEGLKGGEIPLWARMTAVADTYDALTSDRPYRQGMPQAKALQVIEDVKGTQLCPECVDLFIRWYELNE